MELFQKREFVLQVHAIGGAVYGAVTDFSLRANNESCRVGNAIMLERISEFKLSEKQSFSESFKYKLVPIPLFQKLVEDKTNVRKDKKAGSEKCQPLL